MVKHFQKVIGDEARLQFQEQNESLPDYVVACVGGGSNAIGIFSAFLNDRGVKLIGVEPAGKGLDTDSHGAVLSKGTPGCLHGMKSLLLQDGDGQVFDTHSIAAGLDYPSVGPEHAYLQSIKRAQYFSATDDEALSAYGELARSEGIIPALESAHAIAYVKKLAAGDGRGKNILINLSGRGDKDIEQVMQHG
jgi:tryptophan synthase beta subunit